MTRDRPGTSISWTGSKLLLGHPGALDTDHQRRFAQRIAQAVGRFSSKRIALLSLAFKEDSGDVRSSPALRLAARLPAGGADLGAHNPAAGDNAGRGLPDLVVVPTVEEALQGADAAIATEWPDHRDLDWATLRAPMRRPLIIYWRRLLPYAQLRSSGYVPERIGDGMAAEEP